jgi:hypothetical protein
MMRGRLILTVLYKMVLNIIGIIIKAISLVGVVALMGTLRLVAVMRLVGLLGVPQVSLLRKRLLIIGLGLFITFLI